MDVLRLRNLTTGKLHTDIGFIYQDIEHLTGFKGVMTHQLPAAFEAMQPWLKEMVEEPEFWNDEYDPDASGEYDILPMDEVEQQEFWKAYNDIPNPLFSIGSGR